MTSSYLVLKASAPAIAPDDKMRFIRDGFSLVAFLFPVLWLLAHRLWLLAILALLLESLAGMLIGRAEFWPAGAAIALAVSLLAGLEGQNMRVRKLVSGGWTNDAVVRADSLDAAEEIYFSGAGAAEEAPSGGTAAWDRSGEPTVDTRHSTSLGLFGFDGGR